MKQILKIIIALCLAFIIGLSVGITFFRRTTVNTTIITTEEILQNNIDNKTNKFIKLFEDLGFQVEKKQLFGIVWIQFYSFEDFVKSAIATNTTVIYLYLKTAFITEPIFFIPYEETAIIYEPF